MTVVTANGGFLSKHAIGVFSTTPFVGSWAATRREPAEYQREIDEADEVDVAAAPNGVGVVETYTVAHDRRGPKQAIVVGTMRDGPDAGKRFVATSRESAAMERLMRDATAEEDPILGPSALHVAVSSQERDGGSSRATFALLPAAPPTARL